MLVSQIRHLEVLAPGLRGIIVKLLKERDYTIPEEGIKRWKPAEGEIVMQPLVEKINVAVLDRMPAPNGYITVYAKDCRIDEELASGTFNKKIRVELPHTARPDSCEAIAEFFKTTHPNARLTFERGESLLPCGSEAAGTIIMVGGVNDAQKFEVLKTGLKAFYVVKPDIIGRAPNSAQSNEPKAHQDIPF